MRRIAFSSDMLPAHLDDRARLALWHEKFAPIASHDVCCNIDRPFVARTDLLLVGDITIINLQGTFSRFTRTPRHISADGNDWISITFNAGRTPWLLAQGGREVTPRTGIGVYCDHGEPFDFRSDLEMGFLGVAIPRKQLLEAGANVPGAIRTFAGQESSTRHLQRYLAMLVGSDGIEDSAQLVDHVRTTLIGLVALAIGARGDAAEAVRGRGLRSARARQIIAEIKKGFADPAFSTTTAAHALGMSPRYLQYLLHETGATFTEHVNELRLRKAHKMLASPLHDALKIKDIAHACGFGDIPYFNRAFRRRFGLSPSDCRNPRAATGSDKT